MSNINTSKAAALAAAKAAAAQAKLKAEQAAKDATNAERQAVLAKQAAIDEAAKKADKEAKVREQAKQVDTNKEGAQPSEAMKAMNQNKADKAAKKAERKAARDAAKKATADRKAKVAALKDSIKALKAKGAKMTDDDKQAIKEMRIELKLVKGAVGGKAKIAKLVAKALAALNSVTVEAGKFQTVDAVVTALMHATANMTALSTVVDAADFKRPAKPGKAKAKKEKFTLQVGTLLVLRDTVKADYAEIIDNVDAEFRVVKLSDKKVVVVGDDGNRALFPIAHLKPLAA